MTSDQEIRLAIADISGTLEQLVVGPTSTSVPAMRARYQLTLLKEMLGSERPWFYYRTKIAEFDKTHAEKAKKAAKAES